MTQMTAKCLLRCYMMAMALIMLPIAMVTIIVSTVTTGYQFRVLDYEYDAETDTVTMSRSVLRGEEQLVRSYISVTGSDGHTCYYREERVYYARDSLGNRKTQDVFQVPEQLEPCLSKAPYNIEGRFHTFFGPIRLKPTFYFEPPRKE